MPFSVAFDRERLQLGIGSGQEMGMSQESDQGLVMLPSAFTDEQHQMHVPNAICFATYSGTSLNPYPSVEHLRYGLRGVVCYRSWILVKIRGLVAANGHGL